MRRAHTGGPMIAGPRVRGRLAALHRPDARRDPHRRLDRATPSAKGGVLLAFYALGLAVPFILSALAFSTFSGVFRFFRDHYREITVVSGVILIVMGVLLYTNELTRLNADALNAMDTSASTSSTRSEPKAQSAMK